MPTRDAWLRAVRGVVLKSNPDGDDTAFAEAFTRQLVSETEDGVEIQPLYDSSEPIDVGLPGFAPYVRSTHAAPSPWEIRQRVWSAVDGSSARGELEGGATGVLVELPADADAAVVAEALDGVFLDLAPVSLSTPANEVGLTAARALADRVGRGGDRGRGATRDARRRPRRHMGAHRRRNRPRLRPGRRGRPRRRADRERPARQGRGRRRHRVARRRCDRRPGDRLERRRGGAHGARPRRGRGAARPGEPPARVPLGRDRRPVRDDRQVPRRTPRVGAGRRDRRPPAGGPHVVPPRRLLAGDDDPLRPVGERPAFHRGVLRRGHGRRRRRHRPAPRRPVTPTRSMERHGARSADRPQHPDRPAAGEQPGPRRRPGRRLVVRRVPHRRAGGARRGANCSASRRRVASSPRSRPASCTSRSATPAPPASDASPPAGSPSPA